MAAAGGGHREVAALLLAKGASVDKGAMMLCGDSWTPLRAAAATGSLTTVVLLLSKGADVNLASQPLIKSAAKGHCAVMDLLLAKGADINKSTTNGNTPLHVATVMGHLSAVELLLVKGADVDKKNTQESAITPLQMAASQGNRSIVQLLLSKGADAHAVHKRGETPAALAASLGHHDISALLLSWNPRPASTADSQSKVPTPENDDRGRVDEQSVLPCQCAAVAPNPVAQVTKVIERVESTLCIESAERAESTERLLQILLPMLRRRRID